MSRRRFNPAGGYLGKPPAPCIAGRLVPDHTAHDAATTPVPGVCRVCGCTDARACPGGCAWADAAHTLCTSCAPADQRFVTQIFECADGALLLLFALLLLGG